MRSSPGFGDGIGTPAISSNALSPTDDGGALRTIARTARMGESYTPFREDGDTTRAAECAAVLSRHLDDLCLVSESRSFSCVIHIR